MPVEELGEPYCIRADTHMEFRAGDATSSHTHGMRCVGVVMPKWYDGVLFWDCQDGKLRNRWHRGMHLYKTAERQMKKWRPDRTS